MWSPKIIVAEPFKITYSYQATIELNIWIHYGYIRFGMEPKNYLPTGIVGVLVLTIAALGLSLASTPVDDSMTKIMVSLDNHESSTVFLEYKPTTEVSSSSGMTINFSENKVGPNNVKCTLICQPMEGDTK